LASEADLWVGASRVGPRTAGEITSGLNCSRGVSPLIHRRFGMSCFAQTPFGQWAHPPGSSRNRKAIPPRKRDEGEGAMLRSKCCIFNALECLSAAQVADDPYYRGLNLSLAVIWISLARQEEATADLVAGWKAVDLGKADRTVSLVSQCPPRARSRVNRDHGLVLVVSERGRSRLSGHADEADPARSAWPGLPRKPPHFELRPPRYRGILPTRPRGEARHVGNAPMRRATYDLAGN
jgi:hypothetical protein